MPAVASSRRMSIISPTRPAGARPAPVAILAWLLVVLLPVGMALALHAVQGRVAGLAVDDAFYLLMADRYYGRLAGEPALAALLDTRTYPPLYPLLLGLFGGGSAALLNAYVVNAALLLAWVGFAYAWLLRAGVRPLASALLALAAAFAPATLYHAQVLWSEHLYLLLQMLLLWQLERDPPRARNVLVAGLLVGLMLLTRTAGVAAAVAFTLWLLGRRPQRWGLALALAWLPLAERLAHRASAYGGELQGLFANGPGGALARFAEHGAGLWQGWRDSVSMADPPGLAGPAVLLLLAALGWALRLRRWRFDALLVPVYLAMLLNWGFSQHAPRFLYPLFPIAVYYAWLALSTAADAVPALPRRLVQGGVALVLAAALALPAVAQVAQRLRIPLAADLAAYKNTQMWLAMRPPEAAPYMARSLETTIGDLRRLRELTPAGACVYADSPGMVMVYAHRVPYQSPFTAVEQMVAQPAWPCRYVYVDPYAVDGLRDAARRDRAGVRVLHASRLAPPDGPEEDGGMLLELPTR